MRHTRFILALAMTAGLLFALLPRAQNPVNGAKPGGGQGGQYGGGQGGQYGGGQGGQYGGGQGGQQGGGYIPRNYGYGGGWPGGPQNPTSLQPPASQPAANGPKVVCAVFYQPSTNFAMVQARGVNALYGYDSGANNTMDAWCAAAQQAGLNYYLQCFKTQTPGAGAPVLPLTVDPVAMAHQHDPNLLGYIMPDEPNGVGNLTGAQCSTLYQAVKAAAPNVPVVLNLDGGHVMQFGQAGTGPYLVACDICCFDHYPENYGSQDIPNLKVIANDLATWSGGKPVMEIFEAANMDINVQAWCAGTPLAALMTGPTGAQMKQEVSSGHAGGVSAICWFQDCIGQGFVSYDGTNADEQAAMLSIDTALQNNQWP